MKKTIILSLLSIALITFYACNNDDDIDNIYPVIDEEYGMAFPHSCDTLYRGETFTFKARFTDNKELGSFSLELHENFDHHAHSHGHEECHEDPDKEPVNPFLYVNGFQIPAGSTTYEANVEISIPEDIDTGDYHFEILLTDKEGWQTPEGLAVKILDRN